MDASSSSVPEISPGSTFTSQPAVEYSQLVASSVVVPTFGGTAALLDNTTTIISSLTAVVLLLMAVIFTLAVFLIVFKMKRKRNMPSANNSVISLVTEHDHSSEYRPYNQTIPLQSNVSYALPVVGKQWISVADHDQNK